MTRYVIARTTAGLGNELFQYAAARAVATKADASVAIDSSYFRLPYTPSHLRHYTRTQLPDLGVQAPEINHSKGLLIGAVTRFKKGAAAYNWLLNALGLAGTLPLVAYDATSLQSALDVSPQRLIMRGYWQNFSEIGHFREKIVSDFDLTPSALDSQYVHDIQSSYSTAMHVRLGDYVTDKSVVSTYARLTAGYYRSAVERVRGSADGRSCKFFVFSNDIAGARSVLGDIDGLTYVTGVDHDIREFKLMALCNNQIIANSTFSWWAGWLNSNRDKQVIAPRSWFTDKARETDVWIPAAWMREDN